MESLLRRKTVLFVVVVIAVSSLVGGFLMGGPSEVPPAYAAACQVANGACTWPDTSKTSTLEVDHFKSATPVEPDSTTWAITAYWNTALATCYERSETAYVTVSWDGSGWSTSSTTLTAAINAIGVCETPDMCEKVDLHAYGYKLIVDITDPSGPGNAYNLRRVVYTTTDLNDGNELDTSACSLGSSVTPTADSFSQTDWGPFTPGGGSCPYGCSVGGPSVTITYN